MTVDSLDVDSRSGSSLCSLIDILSYKNVDVPVVMVGTKADLKQDPDTAAEAGERAGVSYLECSSLTGRGVTEVFETASFTATGSQV